MKIYVLPKTTFWTAQMTFELPKLGRNAHYFTAWAKVRIVNQAAFTWKKKKNVKISQKIENFEKGTTFDSKNVQCLFAVLIEKLEIDMLE